MRIKIPGKAGGSPTAKPKAKLKIKSKVEAPRPEEKSSSKEATKKQLPPLSKEVEYSIPMESVTFDLAGLDAKKKELPKNEIIREKGQPRVVAAYSILWVEVLGLIDRQEVWSARTAMHGKHMSCYTLLDPDTGEYMLMTSPHFFAQARELMKELGFPVWEPET